MGPQMKLLVASWDSGGGVEAVQTVVRRAAGRGHQVRVLGTAGLRSRFESAGAGFRVYRYAPDNDTRRPETDLVKDWEARTSLGEFARVRLFGSGLPALNQARAEFGLSPLHDPGDLAARATRILVCTSPSFDFAADAVPGNVCYVGPQLDDGGAAWDDLWAGAGDRPLVLVSLSTSVMRQEGLLQRAAAALGRLPVHAVVTTGPAVDPAVISAPPNVSVRRWARHADVLPYCSAVVTHGGHGTVIKALAAGVPLVVVPLGREQPGNAARVVHAGAGVRIRKNARTAALQAAIARVLDDHRYQAAARRTAAILADERDDGLVVDELERAAARGRPA